MSRVPSGLSFTPASGSWLMWLANGRLLHLGLSGYKDSGPGRADGAALRPQWCCHCKVVVLGSGVRKSFRDLAFVSKVLGCPSAELSRPVTVAPLLCQVSRPVTAAPRDSPSAQEPQCIFDVFSLKPNGDSRRVHWTL